MLQAISIRPVQEGYIRKIISRNSQIKFQIKITCKGKFFLDTKYNSYSFLNDMTGYMNVRRVSK